MNKNVIHYKNAEDYREKHLIKQAKKYFEQGDHSIWVTNINDAACDGYFDLVKYLIKNNKIASPLYVKRALKKGYFEIVEYIIKHNAVEMSDLDKREILTFLEVTKELPKEIDKKIASFLFFGFKKNRKRKYSR